MLILLDIFSIALNKSNRNFLSIEMNRKLAKKRVRKQSTQLNKEYQRNKAEADKKLQNQIFYENQIECNSKWKR